MTPSGARGFPATTTYHRWLGWHAPALRRTLTVLAGGLAAALLLRSFLPWMLAAVGGWDATALLFLLTVWPIILRAEGGHVEELAVRDDETKVTATLLLVGASVASLVGVGFALSLAGRESGVTKAVLTGFALFTVLLSWTVINTVFTLRYADLHFRANGDGIAFGALTAHDQPTYRDFAYVAFTIGMTYQVSDTTVRDPLIRRSVLPHALLAYLFGLVIVAGAINLIAGLLR
ncbi:MAG: DUF1345 domain-containing protein [Jiangellaceae bacterium]|nr:DUF1345 domain-containing protein [Jiangellaceae bacterium]